MKKLPFLFLFFVLFSCLPENEIEEFDPHGLRQEDIATDASGKEYPGLDPYKIYCGPNWGRKFCRFLDQHHETTWAAGGSSIKFSNFSSLVFISIFNLDSIAPFGDKGWELGETNFRGIKWNIDMKRDEKDVLWFDYDYYGSGEEIEYSTTFKFEVIDRKLNFLYKDQTFVFNPS